jgi:HAE1 family hydrophobic/amphiphilic exporter-1
MKRYFAIIIIVLTLFAADAARGQDAGAAPSPTPRNADKQNVSPEDLKGIPAIAPNYRSNERSLPDLGRVGVDITQQRSLTLRDTIELALENNDDIEITRKSFRSAEFDVKAARGFYQPRLAGQAYYDRTTSPNVSIFSTNTTTTQGTFLGNAAVTGYVPKFGTVLTGSLNNSTITTNNPISILSPQESSSLGFSLVQPLFRGRAFDQQRRSIEIAKKNTEISDVQFRQRSIEVITLAEKAYWDLTFALRNLQVQRDSLRDAKEQLAHNRRLVDDGQLAPMDIVAAETQVANFEQSVYDALNSANQAENGLKALIASKRTDPIWAESITPVDPVDIDTPRTTITEAMDTALKNRPELEINRGLRDINALDQKLYRDQRRPQIDLTASYLSSGIGGSLNPSFSNPFGRTTCAVPTSPDCIALENQQRAFLAQIGGGATAYSDIFQGKYPSFRVGINFNLPLFGDKTAGALLGKALVEGEKIETQREQIEQGIQVEVRNALQAIRTAEARLRAAAISRENSARLYESEQRKLDSGQSDIYKVLERQTALTIARSGELRARTELNKAIADLDRATGTTLKTNNVTPKK